jgi:hypothetical protein
VLLVEGHPGAGLGGSLGLLGAALDPVGDGQAAGAVSSSLFAVERCGVSALDEHRLARARVVVLGDVPALEAPAVAALERFVVGGGGILVVAGEGADREIADRFWWRGGDGFLAAPLGAPLRTEKPRRPITRAASHPALEPFASGDAGEAWRQVSVACAHPLDPLPIDATTLLTLDDGAPLLVERARGRGRAALLATGLDGAWTDLPYRAAFVPLARSLTAWLGGVVLPPRNLLAGERLAWFPAEGASGLTASCEGPDGKPVALAPSAWEGHPALLSAALTRPGAYALRPAGAAKPIWFEVGTAPAESRLAPIGVEDLASCLRELPRHAVSDPRRVHELFTEAGNRTWELWRGFALAALALLLVESLLTRRAVLGERAASSASQP